MSIDKLDAEKLADVVGEYLHWRKVNPHVKGGENYLKRLRESLEADKATRQPVGISEEIRKDFEGFVSRGGDRDWERYLERDANGDYELGVARGGWAAWQGAIHQYSLKRESGRVAGSDEARAINTGENSNLSTPAGVNPRIPRAGCQVSDNPTDIEGEAP